MEPLIGRRGDLADCAFCFRSEKAGFGTAIQK